MARCVNVSGRSMGKRKVNTGPPISFTKGPGWRIDYYELSGIIVGKLAQRQTHPLPNE